MAVTIYDKEHSDDEDRFKIIGMSTKLRELTVCHCYRDDEEVTRIISARRATKNEIGLYERGLDF
ncbi:MAG: BrnT family toxin [Defluviitaleaceae bacterium]|nr:BrnT family toxin [Defluviitaleaceae bacterium]